MCFYVQLRQDVLEMKIVGILSALTYIYIFCQVLIAAQVERKRISVVTFHRKVIEVLLHGCLKWRKTMHNTLLHTYLTVHRCFSLHTHAHTHTEECTRLYTEKNNYRIAGNFRGVQFSQKGDLQKFRGLIFADGRSRTACSVHNTWLTLPLTASARGLDPAEMFVKDRL